MECTICRTTSFVADRPVHDDGTLEPICLQCWCDFYASDEEKEMLKDQED